MNDTIKMDELCAKHGLTIESKLIRSPFDKKITKINGKDVKPDWKDTSFHWSVTIGKGKQSLTTDYYMGAGHVTVPKSIERMFKNDAISKEMYARHVKPTPPEVADVVHSLVSDASALDEPFADWASNCGYDDDSIKAKAIYDQCIELGHKIKRLLGKDFEQFQQAEW